MFAKLYRKLEARLLAFDPGYINLRSAVRGTLAVVACFFVLSAVARHLGGPPSLAFLGVLITMMSCIAINVPKKTDQKLSTLLIPVPTAMAASLSVALAEWPYLRLAGFLIVTFAAVSVRRFGQRWQSLGIIVFMGYFATLFFPFFPKDIPLIIVAIFLAAAMTYAARFWILPDRTPRVINLYLRSFDLRLDKTLDKMADALWSSAQQSPLERGLEPSEPWRAVRQCFVTLNELSVGIELFAATNDTPSIRSKSYLFQLKLFEHEMALRRLWDYSFELLHLEDRNPEIFYNAARAVKDLRKSGKSDPRRNESFRTHIDAIKGLSQDEAVLNFTAAIKDVKRTLETQDFSAGDIDTVVQDIDLKEAKASTANPTAETLHISTRQAIQATIATTLASLLGTQASPQRWYWASISAFMVFIGATRGETMMRAVLRILGTVLGLVLGFALAFAFTGKTSLEWTLIVFCVFFGIFAARHAFGFWTAGLFSSMFALLYDILGLLDKDILFLRVEETLIGALIGVVVAAIVLPTSTHSVFREALGNFLRTLSGIVEALPLEAPNPFSRRKLIRRLRLMDRELMDVRLAAAPIIGRGSLMKHGEMPGALHDATMLAHYVRHLGIHVNPRSNMTEKDFHEACMAIAATLRKEADSIQSNARIKKEKLPWSSKPSKDINGPRHSLERIRVAVASIGSRSL